MAQKPLNESGGKSYHLGVRIPDDQAERLEQLAKREDITVSEYVRRLIGCELREYDIGRRRGSG